MENYHQFQKKLSKREFIINGQTYQLPFLILRPFNFETLAVSTYTYASEERMLQAAAPAIAIVLVGLIPIIFLSKMIRSSRPATKK